MFALSTDNVYFVVAQKETKGDYMFKKIISTLFIATFLVSTPAFAKMKIVTKADKNYDFKGVKKIVVLPMKSDNVNFGKVDKDRMPKIEALLKKTKANLRNHMVVGSKQAKTSIPFVENASGKEPSTTLLLDYNFEEFDNGNALARNVPFAGKAKVTLRAKFINAKTKAVVAEMVSNVKAKGGIVGGGLDSEVLWNATNMANAPIYKYLMKQTDLKYNFVSGVVKGTKTGVKTSVDEISTEKQEKDITKKKMKK